jgi:hypothetical protein
MLKVYLASPITPEERAVVTSLEATLRALGQGPICRGSSIVCRCSCLRGNGRRAPAGRSRTH